MCAAAAHQIAGKRRDTLYNVSTSLIEDLAVLGIIAVINTRMFMLLCKICKAKCKVYLRTSN